MQALVSTVRCTEQASVHAMQNLLRATLMT